MSSESQKKLKVFCNLYVEAVCRLSYIYMSVFLCILIYNIFLHIGKQPEFTGAESVAVFIV